MPRSIRIPKENMDDFCRRWKVVELTARPSDEHRSEDIGIFVRFDPAAEWSLTDRIRMENELRGLAGQPVHLRNRHPVHFGRRQPMQVLYDA